MSSVFVEATSSQRSAKCSQKALLYPEKKQKNELVARPDFRQETPLSMSLGLPPGERKDPDFKTANLLVEHGADINAIFNREALFGGTMLHHAVSEGNHEIVEVCLDINMHTQHLLTQ